MKNLVISLLILVASAISASVYAEETVYEGTIGQYKIHMVLDDDFNGYYYYDHRPDSRFKLVATSLVECDEDMFCYRFTLQEYAPGTKKNTGEFVAEFSRIREAGFGMYIIEGTFRNKSTGKTLPFEVYFGYEYSTD
ncbi:MAG: hypothetical protein J6R26_02805 [Paludibacteraceae bacterium]|nr:hypothetical protein [Paludibacteraceae bacterium]